jgi:hypothetical protein
MIQVILTGCLNSIDIATTCAAMASAHKTPAITRNFVAFDLLSGVGTNGFRSVLEDNSSPPTLVIFFLVPIL